MDDKRTRVLTGIALSATIIFWASAFAAIRVALTAYTPGEVAFLRYLTASVVLAVYALAVRMPLPKLRDVPMLAVAGFLGFTAYNMFLNTGEMTVPAGVASFIIASEVGIIALIARLFLKEHPGGWGWVGVLLCIMGVGIISLVPRLVGTVSAGTPANAGGTDFDLPLSIGALLVFGATLSVSIYSVMHKPLLKRYTPIQFITYAIWAGTIFLFFFAPRALGSVPEAPAGPTLAILYMAVLPGVAGYFGWSYVLSNMPASQAGSFLTLFPVLAMVIAWVWLGEIPEPGSLVGSVVVLSGIVLVNRKGFKVTSG